MKSCPHCEAKGKDIRLIQETTSRFVVCMKCGLSGPWGLTVHEASELWDSLPRRERTEDAP